MRNKLLSLLVVFLLSAFSSMAQQLGIGECGIVCTYDAAGNRLKRIYFCNNGIDPYPTKAQQAPPAETTGYQLVDALYPNPTTGKFSVTFSKGLANAQVTILDNNGRLIFRFTASGNRVDFDLSPYPGGMYFIRVEGGGNVVTKKVIKQ